MGSCSIFEFQSSKICKNDRRVGCQAWYIDSSIAVMLACPAGISAWPRSFNISACFHELNLIKLRVFDSSGFPLLIIFFLVCVRDVSMLYILPTSPSSPGWSTRQLSELVVCESLGSKMRSFKQINCNAAQFILELSSLGYEDSMTTVFVVARSTWKPQNSNVENVKNQGLIPSVFSSRVLGGTWVGSIHASIVGSALSTKSYRLWNILPGICYLLGPVDVKCPIRRLRWMYW